MAEKSSHALPPKSANGRVLRNLLLASAVSIAVTAALYFPTRNILMWRFGEQFEGNASARADLIERRLADCLGAARSLSVYLGSEETVDAAVMRGFMGALLAESPEIAALAWVRRAPGGGGWYPALFEGEAEDGLPAGFGAGSRPERDSAMERAGRTGEIGRASCRERV
jgi:hypothetical protein